MSAIRQAYWKEEGQEDLLAPRKLQPGAATVLNDAQKIEQIASRFGEIMQILGLDLKDERFKDTPRRVATMYVREIFSGLDPAKRPRVSLFDNRYGYDQMLVVRDITLNSHCATHFMPIVGRAHVAYFSSGKVIGLSKINRIVQYYANRPQVPDGLVAEIAQALKEAVHSEDVAVTLDGSYLCVASRGVHDDHTTFVSSHYSGRFRDPQTKSEFLHGIEG